jgi:hypothetical protein
MRKASLLVALAACLFVVAPAFAQNPNYDVGPVWRVIYIHIKPGMGDAFWKDFRENIKPLFDTYKKEGWITDYKAFLNDTTEHPGDWDVAIAVLYPNYAALDQFDAKAANVVTKHYGSREAAAEAAKKRAELREIVASHLAREVTPK